MPGFVDSHRHIWEGLLRNIGTDVPLEGRSSYISFVLHKLAPAFRPEDAYIGDLVSALGAIDAGITTLLDWSHIQGSPAHTDAVVQALRTPGCGRCSPTGSRGGGSGRSVSRAGSSGRPPSTSRRGPDAHARARRAGPRVHRLRGHPRPLEARRETDARITTHVGRRELRSGREGPGVRRGGAPRPRHDLHPLHHAQRHRDPDDRRHRRHGLARLTGGDDDGPRDAPDPEVPRPGLHAQPQRGRRDQRPGDMFNQMRSVLGLQRAIADRPGQGAGVDAGGPVPTPRSRGPGPTGSTRRWGR